MLDYNNPSPKSKKKKGKKKKEKKRKEEEQIPKIKGGKRDSVGL